MAKYNIYGHVLYSEIEYEKLMNATKKIFIQSLMNKLPSIKEWTDDIWLNIDHEYMITTLEEIKRDVIMNDTDEVAKVLEATRNLDDIFEINSIDVFKKYERLYAQRVEEFYKRRLKFLERNDYLDEEEYLTQQIKKFNTIEDYKPYRNKSGDIVRKVNPSTYLSMLYNVNLTRTGWNQTFKDAEYFENDLVLLETHPMSCPLCAAMQGKVYSRTGKSKRYPNIEVAYQNGVGHPNCKCEFSIYWDKLQLENQDSRKTTESEYKEDQKKKSIEREIRKQKNDLELYEMIGNFDEADKARQKISNLKSRL